MEAKTDSNSKQKQRIYGKNIRANFWYRSPIQKTNWLEIYWFWLIWFPPSSLIKKSPLKIQEYMIQYLSTDWVNLSLNLRFQFTDGFWITPIYCTCSFRSTHKKKPGTVRSGLRGGHAPWQINVWIIYVAKNQQNFSGSLKFISSAFRDFWDFLN